MRSFHIQITTLEETLLDGDAIHCGVRTEHGALGLEAWHEPFLAALAPASTVTVRDPHGNVNDYPVSEGMLSFADNSCTIVLGPPS